MDEWPKIIDLPLLSSLPCCNPLSRFRVKNPVRRNREPGRRELPRLYLPRRHRLRVQPGSAGREMLISTG